VTIPDKNVPAEKSFTLEIKTTDLTGADIFSVDFKIIFDASILTATNVSSAGTILGQWGAATFNIGAGTVRVSSGGTTALSGSGRLVKIMFRVANNASIGATSPMAFAAFQFNEGTPKANLVNGTFTVIEDTQPPIITAGPSAGSVTSHSAKISWQTDEPGNSVLDYGVTTSYGQTLRDEGLTTHHTMTISDLRASTTYHFRVGSTDKLGNGPTRSADQTFTTADIVASLPDEALDPGATLMIPVSISDITSQNVQSVQMTIQFDSDILSATGVSIDGTIAAGWAAPSFSINPGEVQVTLSGTEPLSGSGILLKMQMHVAENVGIGRETALEFTGFSLNSGDLPAKTRNGSFTVKDTQAPIITFAPGAINLTSNSAVIQWQTNEDATSRVEFGKTSAYGNVEYSSRRVQEHSITLSGLDADATYFFRVSSTDSSGNGPTFSDEGSFTTKPGGDLVVEMSDASVNVGNAVSIPVRVSDLTGQGVHSFHTVIQYDRDFFEFQNVDQLNSIAASWNNLSFDTIGGQIIVGNSGASELRGDGVLFNINLRAKSDIKNKDSELRFRLFFFNSGWPEVTTKSAVLSVLGNPDVTPPVFTFGPVVDQISSQSARVVWMTNEPSSASVDWGESESYGNVIRQDAFAEFHSVDLSGLAAGTNYHVRVNAADQAGNGPAAASDIVFKTLSTNAVAVSLSDLEKPAGAAFQLAVNTGNLSGLKVYSAYVILTFDETLLTANNATSSGTLTAGWGDPVYTITPGRIVIAMGGVQALKNSGSLVKINFTLAADAKEGVKTPVAFERFTYNEGTPPVVLSTGIISVRDVSMPVIDKGPIVFGETPTTTSILWSTNEPTTAKTEYGMTSDYGDEKISEQLSTGHIQVLSGLTANTLYHYQIGSTDAAGNGPVQSGDMTFSTAAEQQISMSLPDVSEAPGTFFDLPINISDVTGLGITSVDFDFKFDANVLNVQSVETGGTLAENWNTPSFHVAGDLLTVSLSGAAVLSGQGILAKIRLQILPAASVGANVSLELENIVINGLPWDVLIRNGLLTVRDNEPPVITSGPFATSITSASAEIVWYTDEPSDAVVEYGTTESYGLKTSDSVFRVEHHIALADLQTNTLYNFRVASTDSFANGPTTSANLQFKTLASNDGITLSLPDTSLAENAVFSIPVMIRNDNALPVTSVDFSIINNSDVIQFTGTDSSGTLSENWRSADFQTAGQSTRIKLFGATPITQAGVLINIKGKILPAAKPGASIPLIFTAVTLNAGSLAAMSGNGAIRIRDMTPPQFVQVPSVERVLFNSATIHWETNEPTRGFIEYGPSISYGENVPDTLLETVHEFSLTNLNADTTYHFRVGIKDSSGNGPVYSPDNSFKTPSADIGISLPDTTAAPNDVISIPVLTTDLSGHNIRKVEMTLTYDPALLIASGAGEQGMLAQKWGQPIFSDRGGELSMTASGTLPLEGGGILATVVFRVSPGAKTGFVSPLTISRIIFNDNDPKATSIKAGSIKISKGSLKDVVHLALPDTGAFPASQLLLPVTCDSLDGKNILSFDFTVRFNDSILKIIAVDTAGSLVSNWNDFSVEGSDSTIRVRASGSQALGGRGTLIFLKAETLPLTSGKLSELNFASFRFNQGYPPVSTGNGSLVIQKRTDVISGFVYETGTKIAVDSVQVHLTPGEMNTQTDSRGFFQFQYLDPAAVYSLSLEKIGFSSLPPIENLSPGGDELVIYLEPKDGFIDGHIRDGENKPIVKALIIADDSNGNFSSANSDSTGYFKIKNLAKSNPYKIKVSKYGYHDKIIENVPVNSSMEIVLDEDFGSIAGTVVFADNSAAQNIRINLTNSVNPLEVEHAVTDENGTYKFEQVKVGNYLLSVNFPGHISDPEQYTLAVAPGQSLNADFQVEKAVLASLSLQVKEEMANNAPSPVFYQALTETGRQMSISDPVWNVFPHQAGVIKKSVFYPNNSYLGSTKIIVQDRTRTFADTASTELFAPVGPGTNRTFTNESGVLVSVSPGSFAEQQKLKLLTIQLPPFKQNAKSATAFGAGYFLKPDDYALGANIRLEFPHDSTAVFSRLSIGRWDKKNAEWIISESVQTDAGTNNIVADISSLGLYAMLVKSKSLGIDFIKYLPNPFSPEVDTDNDGHSGLSIHLQFSSQFSRTPFVTMKIYNLRGEPVRELLNRKPYSKDKANIIYWDGLTDDGLWARNGRYIIHTKIEDGKASVEKVGTVVLVR
ncbi:MAG: hypothetical protein GWP06_08630, partial [Actinobacteria bacterium]|nr:hypothetical protein [Actinomycetota bacterium]